MIRGQHRSSCFCFSKFLGVSSSEAEVEAGNALFDKNGVILRRGVWALNHNIVSSHRLFQSCFQPLSECRVVEDGIRAFIMFNRRLTWSAGRLGFGRSTIPITTVRSSAILMAIALRQCAMRRKRLWSLPNAERVDNSA